MNKRLALLEQMTASAKADAFAWYGLAMEYRRLERLDDALAAFEKLRGQFPDYLPQYLMAGQVLRALSRPEVAKEWLQAGVELATLRGDGKTLGELEQVLAEL
jgi:predicted Zn-dependent protease